jgi:hypothetical protein
VTGQFLDGRIALRSLPPFFGIFVVGLEPSPQVGEASF